MAKLAYPHDTSFLEVSAEFGTNGRLTPDSAKSIIETVDREGFAVVTDLLSSQETTSGLAEIKRILADPDREISTFASSTDIANKRRDFCPLPPTDRVMGLATTLSGRLQDVLLEYCGRSRPVLEVSTLVSYIGSSHQYIHRDVPNVICIFAALDDVSDSQGGTVFAPRTHEYQGTEREHDGNSRTLMRVFQTISNWRIFRHNLAAIRRMRKQNPFISRAEFWSRFCSTLSDRHQPNIARFLLGRNYLFDIKRFSPRGIWNLLRFGKQADANFQLLQVAPKAGSVVIYRSDILHGGPDNRSPDPRYFFSIAYSRDIVTDEQRRISYSLHSDLLERSVTLGDLLDEPEVPPATARAATP